MNHDPVRLLDDPSVPDLLREDLAEAADQPLPPVDTAAGLASLQASIRAGGGAAAGAGATAKAAALAHGSWWGGALIGLGVGLVGAAAIWLAPPLTRSPPPPSPARIEVTEAPALAAPEPRPEPPVIAAAPSVPAALAPSPSARAAHAAPSSPELSPSSPGSPEASASASAVDGPAEELALLVSIKQKASSDPAAALALVEEGHRRFPRGSFHQERESIAILALAQLGRTDEARARAKHFLDAHPQSPYAERLRSLVSTKVQ